MPKPAAEAADKLRSEFQQHRRERAARHQFSRENEQGHGFQRKDINAREHMFGQREQRQIAVDQYRRQCPCAKRKRNRNAKHQQQRTAYE